MTIGVLALQGDFAEHGAVLQSLGVQAREVRSTRDLEECSHLILPGGESTTQRRLLRSSGLDHAIVRRVREGTLAAYGTCAGAILLSAQIGGKNAPEPLGLIDIAVERNAYGQQLDSFSATVEIRDIGPVPVSFIRAPMIVRVGEGVSVLASQNGMPVLVRGGRVLAGAFHPEVGGETAVHRMFLGM